MPLPCASHVARAAVRAILSILTLTGLAQVAVAGVPCANLSTIPPCLAACPQADIAYTVVIRDSAANPIAGSTVTFDFSDCTIMQLCWPVPPPDYKSLGPSSFSTTTNALGSATIHLQAAGFCANGVTIYADGILMSDGVYHPLVSVANTDRTGDAWVTNDDVRQIMASGPSNPTADLDCNGTHDAADNALLVAHLGHLCKPDVDPVGKRTWGQVKIRYR